MANDKECPMRRTTGKIRASQTWRARQQSTLLTFKPVHREPNAAYDFRLRLYVDIIRLGHPIRAVAAARQFSPSLE
jgi:hypothetical protein